MALVATKKSDCAGLHCPLLLRLDSLARCLHGSSGEDLKLEVETYYLKRVYSVSSDFSRSEWESPR